MRRVTTMGLAALVVLGTAVPASAGGRPLTADLSAEQEVGQPGDPGATGVASLELNQGLGEICFEIVVEGTSAPILAGHIHAAPAGQNGPVVVSFDWPATGGVGCVDVDRALVKDIRQHPDEYYVNVHNATAPPGAARGQLG